MTDKMEKRRAFVNQEVAMQLRGRTGISQATINRVYRRAWKKAKAKFP